MRNINANEIRTAIDRYRNQDFSDWSDILNTPLSEEQQVGYQKWVESLPENLRNNRDYDLQGAYLASLQPDKRSHLDDSFKKPNHTTFSNGSIYSGLAGKDGEGNGYQLNGGEWSTDPRTGRPVYTTDPSNRHTKSAMTGYMATIEPGATLVDDRSNNVDLSYAGNNGSYFGDEGDAYWNGAIDRNSYERAIEALGPDVKDIVMDIDETILDNSKGQASLGTRAKELGSFTKALDESHVKNRSYDLVPGSKEFIDAARKNGSKVHLVTGRKNSPEARANIAANLEELGIPYDSLDLSGYGKGISKQPYFDKYNPQMSIGDSLGDKAKDSMYIPLTNTLYSNNRQPSTYAKDVRDALDSFYYMNHDYWK